MVASAAIRLTLRGSRMIELVFRLNSEGVIERVSGMEMLKSQRNKVRLRALQSIRSKMEKEILYFVMKLNSTETESTER
jgi:hypothetical protein